MVFNKKRLLIGTALMFSLLPSVIVDGVSAELG